MVTGISNWVRGLQSGEVGRQCRCVVASVSSFSRQKAG